MVRRAGHPPPVTLEHPNPKGHSPAIMNFSELEGWPGSMTVKMPISHLDQKRTHAHTHAHTLPRVLRAGSY